MFTGLIRSMGTVRRAEPSATGLRLGVEAAWARGRWEYRPAVGESISVSGCCLTVAALARTGVWEFDVVPETLARTTLGSLRPGSVVNLEPSATPGTLLGGHLVLGHVDGVGVVEEVARESGHRVRVRLPPGLMECMTPKGSVAIEGVSLTLAAVEPRASWVEVALIPATLELTTLGNLGRGDPVNVEADAVARTVVHWLKHFRHGGADAGRSS